MHPTLRALLSLAVAAFAGFVLAFLFSPDPTGRTPTLVGVALTALLTPVLYVRMGEDG